MIAQLIKRSHQRVRFYQILLLGTALLGVLDAGYLTYEHYAQIVAPCAPGIFVDCGKVLQSEYSIIFGIPLALLGLVHYSFLTIISLFSIIFAAMFWKRIVFLMTAVGVVASLYFVYLQLFVIGAICLYCIASALCSFALYYVARRAYSAEYQKFFILKTAVLYQHLLKPILFLMNPETVHVFFCSMGDFLGRFAITKKLFAYYFSYQNLHLSQTIAGIHFKAPVGLSAGFDYTAQLTQILPSLGFGFETIGTISNLPYEGNPRPMLGRLPLSKALMVNKGFKNAGAAQIISVLMGKKFTIPVGISIGRTNTTKHKTIAEAVSDVVSAFKLFEKSHLHHSYYELNISCPNLLSNLSFYEPEHLSPLLAAVHKLNIKKPIFVKMPISKSNKEVIIMLDEIVKYRYAGVIFGNLQTNRKDSSLDQTEVKQWKVGNFSGKPTQKRSNELIKLAYQNYGKKLVIIGTGGIFSAQDAYTKIKLGASVVQLITGMIYQGPQLIAQINMDLVDLLKRDGYKNISEAVGADVKSKS